MPLLDVPNLSFLVCDSPIYLIWLVGLVVAFRRRQEHPSVARPIIIGIGILFANRFLASVVMAFVLQYAIGNASQINLIVGVVKLISICIEAIGWAIILRTIFGFWNKKKHEELFNDVSSLVE